MNRILALKFHYLSMALEPENLYATGKYNADLENKIKAEWKALEKAVGHEVYVWQALRPEWAESCDMFEKDCSIKRNGECRYHLNLIDSNGTIIHTKTNLQQWYKQAHKKMQLLYVTSRMWGEGKLFAEGNILNESFLNPSEEDIDKLITASLKRLSPFLE